MPGAHVRDELHVVVLVPSHQLLCPPLQEVVQGGVGVRAHPNLILLVPYLQAHQDHTEIELLIKLGGQGTQVRRGDSQGCRPCPAPCWPCPSPPRFCPPCPRGSPPPSPGCARLLCSQAVGTGGRQASAARGPPAGPSPAPTPCPPYLCSVRDHIQLHIARVSGQQPVLGAQDAGQPPQPRSWPGASFRTSTLSRGPGAGTRACSGPRAPSRRLQLRPRSDLGSHWQSQAHGPWGPPAEHMEGRGVQSQGTG